MRNLCTLYIWAQIPQISPNPRFDQPAATGEKSAMLEPKFLVPYAEAPRGKGWAVWPISVLRLRFWNYEGLTQE